ncbi:methionine--tRNA ligase, cytoplasmic [Thrips palmi]|uniref:Methionine--tRNA ligase, cytoplasmic n=1 Tax=Thrips palmi TaxID=161013 RepID=A0A6P8ZNH8_THRPL|nr:methionine--tRNA ligase, cytoplasmic [Thrips palmi]
MKILTNEKNPAVLKLLVSASLAKVEVTCQDVSFGDKKPCVAQCLPVLQLDSGLTIASVNQAARFIFPPSSSAEAEVDQWLDWDSSQLQPAVVYCVSSPGKSNTRLQSLLSALDVAVKSGETLVKGGISVADVCVWVSLFPIVADTKLCSEWIGSLQNLKTWWTKHETNPAFKIAVSKSGVFAGPQGIQTLLSTSWNASVSHQSSSVPNESEGAPDKKKKTKAQSATKSATSLENGLEQLSISTGPATSGPEWEKELQAAKLAWDSSQKVKSKENVKPVLPVSGERNVLITSALPYVNNVPHLGNIIGCVLSADVFARYCRLRNYNTLYISGTDEYGTATETKALEEGLQPQEICDKYNAIHNDIYKWFNIDFDLFGRTTIPEQTEITQQLFLRLHKLGYMHTEPMEQLLCQRCDRFLADRFVEGTCPKCAFDDARGDQCDSCGALMNATELIKPRCKLCNDTPVIRNSDQFFLDLPKIEPKLSAWFDKSSSGWSHNARVITKAWLKDGLRPRCITRDLKWGIPVPLDNYRSKVFYVWFDAPIGYISMTKKYTNKWKEWWQPKSNTKVEYFQFMAKDNVPFHSIMFPSTLLAADEGYTVVTNLMATEYLNYEDGKFSKSRGTGVFGNDARDTGIPADYWRFYLLFVRPESQDSNFSWDDLALRLNNELLNNLGNFVNRALMFVEKTFQSTIPEMYLEKEDITLLALVNRELSAYVKMLEAGKLREGLRHILCVSRHGNQYIQSQQPWVKAKGSPEEKKQAGTTVGVAANISCLLAILLQPYMPEISKVMHEQMNSPKSINVITDSIVKLLPAGHKIGKPAPLFTKIEASQTSDLKKRFAGKQAPPSAAPSKKGTSAAAATSASSQTVEMLQAAVDKQANLVREMKGSGKPKAEWQPHVSALLQLKADLAAAQKAAESQSTSAPSTASSSEAAQPAQIAELEEAVKKQGDLVREMKASGKSKEEWQGEVAKLLQLKQALAAVQPPTTTAESKPTQSSGSGKSKNKKKK